ncbi:hypothetical protein I315_04258 [Cryptococcus gattii Ru294]|uniref:Uncharacterized protein n=2 Tax=Cryptococcus gattii TaxID=37769 RepID=E6R0Z5_CRYGW|nr:Hypothetical Protein CGB_B5470C [Cryptococcus gattii WM276]ADV20504.1 Hypothetical Protein CGB_B5470C [Cryptococcus gattii WM276]KIR53221.1 hypothetical protein I315_04258 [Cryptococcus gattii Ru294]KIR76985.1 hypothetical protein I306_06026 [Cryptococcus gattii EJB2]KIY31590.1 hypothetical protein I305_06062 [Cryptococcus gattii E566]
MSAPETTSPAPAAAPSTARSEIPASSIPPKPVTPAENLTEPPARALDAITEPTILDRARDIAKPYLDKAEPYVQKVQDATKPYADKAAAKLEQLVDKIEGNDPSTSAVPTSAGTLDDSVNNVKATTVGTAERAAAVAEDTGEKAKGFFEQGFNAVQSTFNQLTNTIEQKTTTDAHPGIITQMSNAVHKGLDKVEGLLNEAAVPTVPPSTSAAAIGTDNNTSTSHPVQTTTNTVPHIPIVP